MPRSCSRPCYPARHHCNGALVSFHDLRQLADNSEFSADICIIGAGPAGLSIALQFQDTSARVCVVESGGLERHENIEALNEFENVGLFRTMPDLARCRGLGGTSNLWTGRCGVFDAIDYQPRPWLPFSGWPIQYDDVSPFFDRAGQLLGLGPALYDHRAREVLRQHTADAPWDPQRLLPVVWQFSRGDGEQVAPPSTPGEVNSADHLRALQHAGARRAP